MRTQSIAFGGTWFLIVCLAFPVAAAPPDCGDCKYWDGDSCELIGECTDGGECPGCQTCSDCYCEDDDFLCHWLHDSCHVCVDAECVNTCKPGQHCCYGQCKECCGAAHCAPYECCIDGVCVDPICGNCHAISETLFECGHHVGDPNGTPCASNWCIRTYLNTATCDYKGPDWPCVGLQCDTDLVWPLLPEYIQEEVNGPCLGVPGNVNWQTWMWTHMGCDFCAHLPHNKACETFGCIGPAERVYLRANKMECGCD